MASYKSACTNKLLVAGHSFVRRLTEYVDGKNVTIHGHKVAFHGFGGATAKTLMAKLRSIDPANFCAVFVETGTNDLCSSYVDIVARDILSLVTFLRDRGIRKIVVGEILFRNKPKVGQPSVREFIARVRDTNLRLKKWFR